MKKLLSLLFVSTGLLFSDMSISGAFASPNLSKDLSYYVVQQDVTNVFKDLSKIIEIPVVVAVNVKGRATAGQYSGPAKKVFEELCADMNLHWYYDGQAIYITKASDAITHVLALRGFGYADLQKTLMTFRIDTKQFPLNYDDENGMVVLYGPPRYIATVELIADNLAITRNQKPHVLRAGL